jgi:type II secretory pathway pseudopilin PulG
MCPPRSTTIGTPRSAGFTLAEMLVLLVILGVLAAAHLPNYIRSVQRAKRSEALYALRGIHDAQSYYFANENQFADSFDTLAFELEGGAPRPDGAYQGPYYTYSLERWDLGSQPNANFRATATADLDPSDATLDIVIIENSLTVKE